MKWFGDMLLPSIRGLRSWLSRATSAHADQTDITTSVAINFDFAVPIQDAYSSKDLTYVSKTLPPPTTRKMAAAGSIARHNSDYAFLNEPYNPLYNPLPSKPILVHQ